MIFMYLNNASKRIVQSASIKTLTFNNVKDPISPSYKRLCSLGAPKKKKTEKEKGILSKRTDESILAKVCKMRTKKNSFTER